MGQSHHGDINSRCQAARGSSSRKTRGRLRHPEPRRGPPAPGASRTPGTRTEDEHGSLPRGYRRRSAAAENDVGIPEGPDTGAMILLDTNVLTYAPGRPENLRRASLTRRPCRQVPTAPVQHPAELLQHMPGPAQHPTRSSHVALPPLCAATPRLRNTTPRLRAATPRSRVAIVPLCVATVPPCVAPAPLRVATAASRIATASSDGAPPQFVLHWSPVLCQPSLAPPQWTRGCVAFVVLRCIATEARGARTLVPSPHSGVGFPISTSSASRTPRCAVRTTRIFFSSL